MAKRKRLRLWTVVYRVKYSELWCADECSWIEDADHEIRAVSAAQARRIYRRRNADRPRFIIGRHVSTYRTRYADA